MKRVIAVLALGAALMVVSGCGGTSPDTRINSKPDDPANSGSASFTFSSNKDNATFECRLDDASFTTCTSPKEYSNLSIGSHTFEVRATADGEADITPDSYTWTVQPKAENQMADLNKLLANLQMSTFFNVLANVIVVLVTLVMVAFIARLIFQRGPFIGAGRSQAAYRDHRRYQVEVVIRIVAALTGFLIYFGSTAVGLSIPSLMLQAISTTHPASIGVFGGVAPAAAGIIVAWYCLRTLKKSEELGLRLLVLLSTFIIVLFGDVYVASLANKELSPQGLNVSLLPNLTFTIGICLYIIFRYLPGGDTRKADS